MAESLLDVRDLRVSFETPDGTVEAVRGVSLALAPGESLAIVGESGSGKSQTLMAVMGLLPPNGKAAGSAKWRGRELIGAPKAELNKVRGSKISMIFQEPMTSLDPLQRVGAQIMEPIMRHGGASHAAARARALELLELVGIPEAARRIDSYPYELSGGQRQRVMIAMAISNNPELLIADEPTTALDVTIQAQILDLLRDLQKRLGMAVILITHDLGVVRHFASRVLVMRRGELVEQGTVEEIFTAPKTDYARALLDAAPRGRKAPTPEGAPVLLEAKGVTVEFPREGGWPWRRPAPFRAVENAALSLRAGQTIGLVGESGSGKSTLGRALLRLTASQGAIRFDGKDIAHLDKGGMRPLRRHMQVVFQDPYGSLSPRLTAGDVIAEGLLTHAPELDGAGRERRAAEAMESVGLNPDMRNRYPHEFSGGQRQRIAIARAMILRPKLVILDEPTSALDRSVQGQVLDLLRDLQRANGLSYLFISHDLAVIRAMADHVMVMKSGKIVEEGPTEQIFNAPREDYTRALIKAALAWSLEAPAA